MPAKTLSPQEVRDLFNTNTNAAYIDVRPVAEFAAGHPRGKVVNIPMESDLFFRIRKLTTG